MDTTLPKAFEEFTARFPGLAKGWEMVGEASRDGPLSAREVALVKIAIALGARLEGPFHSAVRKADAAGVPRADMEQVLALSAATLGFPTAVAGYTWMSDGGAAPRR